MSENGEKKTRLMGFREYSRHRNLALYAIQTAIKTGRITPIKDGNGREWIDAEIADKEFVENTDPSKQNHTKNSSISPETPRRLVTAKADAAHYQARLKKLELKEKEGKLVSAADVKREAETIARKLRNAILNIPDRLSSQLAAEIDPHRVHVLLTEELNRALEELADAGKSGDGI